LNADHPRHRVKFACRFTAFLKRLSQSGMKPSVELAGKWYAVAAGLGDKEAAMRVAALPTR
jgi:hypothetical protein